MTAVAANGEADVPTGLVEEVRDWLAAHWNPQMLVRDWWELVAAAGWSKPQFPTEIGGRGLPMKAETVVREVFKAHGALPGPGGLGHLMAAPTIVTEGTSEQVQRFVPPILSGTVAWCQLFSEPSNGSDLAGLTTRAVRDGDTYVVTGQKVWTSQAHESDFGMLLARTDPEVPKHRGISWIVLALDQPGIEVRPLKEMTGRAFFNEVFIDEAVASVDDVVGGEGQGWRVAQTTLYFERSGIGPDGTHSMVPNPGTRAGNLERRAGDAVHDEPPAFAKLEVDDLFVLARMYGRNADPVVRQELARLVSFDRTSVWTARRARSTSTVGQPMGLASLGKLAGGRVTRRKVKLANELVGPHGMLQGADGPLDGDLAEATLSSGAVGIGGGTDEVQRNIIGERILGLPRDDRTDATVPFSQIPKNSTPASHLTDAG